MIEIRHTEKTQYAYDQIYRGQGLGQRDSFYLWLLSLLRAQPGATLLDISCGEGQLVAFARQQGLEAFGTDFSVAALQLARQRFPQNIWFVADGEKIPIPSDSMDYVTHIGSLEHYHHPLTGMSEVARILKPGGTACILLPNSFGLLGNIKHVYRTGDIFDDGQPLQRYNTLAGWKRMLEQAGLRPFRTLGYEWEWPRTKQDWIWCLKRPQKLLRALLQPLMPVSLANCIVYLCNSSLRNTK